MEDLLFSEFPDLTVELKRRAPPTIASREFDSIELIEAHAYESKVANSIANRRGVPVIATYLSMENNAPLQDLNPISLQKLQVGTRHRGRVFHGTLCVEAYKLSAIATVVRDDEGRAVRLRIYDGFYKFSLSLNSSKIAFPIGARVAVKEPVFKIALDGCMALHVYDISCIYVFSSLFASLQPNFIFSAGERSSTDWHSQEELETSVSLEQLFEETGSRGYRGSASISQENRAKVSESKEFIGPLEIRHSPNISGRGLFVTRNVKRGELLITSNSIAFAEAKNFNVGFVRWDTCKPLVEELVSRTLRSASASKQILQQMICLDDTLFTESSKIPSMGLFRPTADEMQIDESAIRRIIESNVAVNFPRLKCESSAKSASLGLGLWGLPSFINHSCYPNASAYYDGKVMFVCACRDIPAGEEITRSYCDSFRPLPMREKSLGFPCCCRRCLRDSLLRQELKRLENQYDDLLYRFGKSVTRLKSGRCIMNADFANAALRKQTNLEMSDSDAARFAFAKFAAKLEKTLDHLKRLRRQTVWWIRASFAAVYAMAYEDANAELLYGVPAKEVMVRWLTETDPSHPLGLLMAAKYGGSAYERAQSCLSVYGKQSQEFEQLILSEMSVQMPFDFI